MSARAGSDVVVVGGGAAGCVVAARLAAAGDRSVLLLEAGPDPRAAVSPALRDAWHLPRGADWAHDWGYLATTGPDGNTQPVRRGRLLGGTSWLTRFAVRGAAADFDAWGAQVDPHWSFEQVLPAFTRLETDMDFGSAPWHGDDGPIPIDRYRARSLTPVHAAAIEAFVADGFAVVDDVNQPGAVGVGRIPMSSRDGERVTSADGYVPPGREPANLAIRVDALVAELVVDRGRVVGVRLTDGSEVRAGHVILCAGTYGSPLILLRSGIGPAADLLSLGIPVTADLPGVGANLADHAGVELDLGWDGPGRSEPVLHSMATFHSRTAGHDAAPDLMFWVGDPDADDPAFAIDTVLLKPRSRGSVRLRSADAGDPPLIELPGLRDTRDLERLVEGISRAVAIVNRPEIRRLVPAPAPHTGRSRDDLRQMVRAEFYSIPHVVGTCAMGRSPDDGAVVDGFGKVHGIDGLSVVDASIMPDAPSGFPHLVTLMIAERLSEHLPVER